MRRAANVRTGATVPARSVTRVATVSAASAAAVAVATSLVLATASGADAAPPGVPTPTAASGGAGNHLVALGDSWAAGTAAGAVDRATAACRRSARGYVPRVAAQLGQTAWVSRACATTATSSTPAGTTSPATTSPATTSPSAPADPPSKAPTGGLLDGTLGSLGTLDSLGGALGSGRADEQFGVLDRTTRVVTASVGADAIGLGSLAHACSTAGTVATCSDAATRSDRALAALPAALQRSLDEVHRRSPEATVVLVGYPRLSEGVACTKGAADLPRAARVDAAVAALDKVVADRATNRVRFVDVREAFRGHGSCAPDAWLTPFTGDDVITAAAPTAVGQTRGYTPVVATAVRQAGPTAPSSKPTKPATKNPAATAITKPTTKPTTKAPSGLALPLFGG